MQGNNNMLYLLVGALVVALGFMAYLYAGDPGDDTTTVIESSAEPDNESSTFSLEMDEDGVSATQTETNENNGNDNAN